MKFEKILKEVFADKRVDDIDGYKKQQQREEEPKVITSGLNDINPDGTLKKRKKGEIR